MQDVLKITKQSNVSLPDYDFQKDIHNRLLLRSLTKRQRILLEEILFSPLHFPIESLAESLSLPIDEVYQTIESLSYLDLFNFDGKFLTVEKDRRKYFEVQLSRFEKSFKPNVEFIQNLLKCLPIEVLPSWYNVSRSSNNIFQSLLDRYLITPKIYQRYVSDSISQKEIIGKIAQEVFFSNTLKIPVKRLLKKYDLSREAFEKILISLEFNLLCFLSFETKGDRFTEVLTPFYEWRQYQLYLKTNYPTPLKKGVLSLCKQEYAFIQDMTILINLSEKTPLSVVYQQQNLPSFPPSVHAFMKKHLLFKKEAHLERVLEKVLILELGILENNLLKPSKTASKWKKNPPYPKGSCYL